MPKRIGMVINAQKTKLMCMSVARNSEINSYINIEGGRRIYGEETPKILGFVFGKRPTAEAHINHICKRFYSKVWVIRHMMRANTRKTMLTEIYAEIIRPVAYDALLTTEMSRRLENLQKTALKIIYGFSRSYQSLLEISGLETLTQRRKKAVQKFASKTLQNQRFGNLWFEENLSLIHI